MPSKILFKIFHHFSSNLIRSQSEFILLFYYCFMFAIVLFIYFWSCASLTAFSPFCRYEDSLLVAYFTDLSLKSHVIKIKRFNQIFFPLLKIRLDKYFLPFHFPCLGRKINFKLFSCVIFIANIVSH